MGSKGLTARLGLVTALLLPHAANAGDMRASLTMSAYVSVAGSIDVKASTAQSSAHTQTASAVAGEKVLANKSASENLSNCTAVTLICTGPSSMRIAVHTDGDEAANSDAAGTDACASPARVANGSLLLCNNTGSQAPNILGVTIDY